MCVKSWIETSSIDLSSPIALKIWFCISGEYKKPWPASKYTHNQPIYLHIYIYFIYTHTHFYLRKYECIKHPIAIFQTFTKAVFFSAGWHVCRCESLLWGHRRGEYIAGEGWWSTLVEALRKDGGKNAKVDVPGSINSHDISI